MRHYIGIIHKDPDSAYGISFPDFPGCISAGDTLQEVMTMGAEALAFHIEAMTEDGETIPEPSEIDKVMADPDFRDGVAVLVPAEEIGDHAVRVNISLPERLLRRIDAASDNRSRFLAEAAERALAKGAATGR